MRTSHIVLLLLLALLLSAAPCGAQRRGQMMRGEYSDGAKGEYSDGAKVEYVWLDDRKGIEVRASGEIDLREGAPGVEGISPRGYLIVEQRVGSAAHRAEWHPVADGGVSRSYTVDGRPRDFAEARPWLDRFFPEAVRKTTIEERARLRRVLEQRGASGALREAAGGSDRTRELFLQALAERDLTPAETQRFIEALGGISSSGTRRELLLKAARRPLTAEQWTSWLAAASEVASGSDQRELLLEAVARYPRREPLPNGFLRALDAMPSSSDRREVLTALIAARGGEPETLPAALASAARLPSSSDRREVLAALLHEGTVLRSPPAAVAWLSAVKQVPADSDRAALLMASIGRLPAGRPVRAAFLEALETLSSTYYKPVAAAYLRSQAEGAEASPPRGRRSPRPGLQRVHGSGAMPIGASAGGAGR